MLHHDQPIVAPDPLTYPLSPTCGHLVALVLVLLQHGGRGVRREARGAQARMLFAAGGRPRRSAAWLLLVRRQAHCVACSVLWF